MFRDWHHLAHLCSLGTSARPPQSRLTPPGLAGLRLAALLHMRIFCVARAASSPLSNPHSRTCPLHTQCNFPLVLRACRPRHGRRRPFAREGALSGGKQPRFSLLCTADHPLHPLHPHIALFSTTPRQMVFSLLESGPPGTSMPNHVQSSKHAHPSGNADPLPDHQASLCGPRPIAEPPTPSRG